jgi:hypothetical protein
VTDWDMSNSYVLSIGGIDYPMAENWETQPRAGSELSRGGWSHVCGRVAKDGGRNGGIVRCALCADLNKAKQPGRLQRV